MASILTATNHDRDVAGLKYIYPVISRRAGGLSIGVNFNTNNACNWQCVYCQVPDLTIGSAPDLDLAVLEKELKLFLDEIIHGDFYEYFNIEKINRAIKDIAISGNGEPTSVKNFAQAVKLIGDIAAVSGVFPSSHYVLITNGSLIHQQKVQEGLKILDSFGGEVWFKFDSATRAGRALINHTGQSAEASLRNISISASLCATKLQTCLVDYDGKGVEAVEKSSYLNALQTIKAETRVKEVMLYTLARPSLQPEAPLLKPLDFAAMNEFADNIREIGYLVSVSC